MHINQTTYIVGKIHRLSKEDIAIGEFCTLRKAMDERNKHVNNLANESYDYIIIAQTRIV